MAKSGVIAALVAAVALAQEDAGSKIAEFQALSRGGIATLSDANFHKLVRSANRPYHTFVIFNARDPQYQCALCGPFEDELQVLAASYWRQKESDADAPPIFFARADVSQTRSTFSEYQLTSAPLLVYFGPTSVIPHPKNKFPANSQYASEMDAENAALFVRERTDYVITVHRSMWPKLLLAVGALAAVAVAILYMGTTVISIFESIRKYTLLWLLGAVVLYFISVSGVLYNIIRGVPPFGFNPRTKRVELISQQSGTQYQVEGLIMGAFNLLAAAAVIALTRVLPTWKDSSTRTGLAVAAGMAFLVAYYFIYFFYHYKNPWYSISALLR